MKKTLTILFSGLIFLGLCSCNDKATAPTPTPIPYKYVNSQYIYQAKDILYTDLLPDYVSDIYTAYSETISKLDPNLVIGDKVFLKEELADFKIYDTMEGDISRYNSIFEASFYLNGLNDDKSLKRKFSFSINLDNPQSLKKLFAATFLITDNSLSVDDAISKANEFIIAFSNNHYGNIVESGDYLLYTVTQIPITKVPYSRFYVKHKDNIFLSEEEKQQYTEVDYSIAQNGRLNKDLKIFLKGTVDTDYSSHTLDNSSVYFIIVDENGDKYRILQSQTNIPKIFQVGDTYTFYGIIRENEIGDPAHLTLKSYE